MRIKSRLHLIQFSTSVECNVDYSTRTSFPLLASGPQRKIGFSLRCNSPDLFLDEMISALKMSVY